MEEGDGSTVRRVGWAGVFVWSVVVALVAFSWWMLTRLEPLRLQTWLRIAGFLITFTVLTAAAVVVAWRSRRWAGVVVAPLALFAGGAAILVAEPLHWRWSRAAFDRVAAGELEPCPAGSYRPDAWAEYTVCGEVGWWRVTGVTEHDGTVVVWVGFHDCYAGDGLARPANPEAGAEGVRASLRGAGISATIFVTPWRDGWYEVCMVT